MPWNAADYLDNEAVGWDGLSREDKARGRELLFESYVRSDPALTKAYVDADEGKRNEYYAAFAKELDAQYPDKFVTQLEQTPEQAQAAAQDAERETREMVQRIQYEPDPARKQAIAQEYRGRIDATRNRRERVPILDVETEKRVAQLSAQDFDDRTVDDNTLGQFGPIVTALNPKRGEAMRAEAMVRARRAGLSPEGEVLEGAIEGVDPTTGDREQRGRPYQRARLEDIFRRRLETIKDPEERKRYEAGQAEALRRFDAQPMVDFAYQQAREKGRPLGTTAAMAALSMGTGAVIQGAGVPMWTARGMAMNAAADAVAGAAYAKTSPGYLGELANKLTGREDLEDSAVLGAIENAGIGLMFGALSRGPARERAGQVFKDYARRHFGFTGETNREFVEWMQNLQKGREAMAQKPAPALPGDTYAGRARKAKPVQPVAPEPPEPVPAPPAPGEATAPKAGGDEGAGVVPGEEGPMPSAPTPGAIALLNQQANASLPEQIVPGAATSVLGARGVDLPGVYIYAPRGLVVASHRVPDFSKNPEYPLENTRDYSNLAEQEKVLTVRNNFDPRRHVTDSMDAAVGPSIVAHVIDESGKSRMVVLGGNNREMAMSMLTPERQKALDDYTAANAERKYGLPPMQPGQAVYRFVGDYDLREAGTREKLQGLIDALNPSPGKVQNMSEQAMVDAENNVPTVDLVDAHMNMAPGAAQHYVRSLIRGGKIDRNLRSAFAESGVQAQSYVNHLLLHAAYKMPTLVEARMDSRAGDVAVVRNLVDAGVPATLALRGQGRHDIADAMARTFFQIARQVQAKVPMARILGDLTRQGDMDASMDIVRELTEALEKKLVTTKTGRTSATATSEGWEALLDDIGRALKTQESEPDMFGNQPNPVETMRRAIKFHFDRTEGGEAAPVESGGSVPGGALMEPAIGGGLDPGRANYRKWVKRLRDLRKQMTTRNLSPTEHAEIDSLERALGQQFMDFYSPRKAPEGPAAGGVEKPLEDDTQLTLFERRQRYAAAENQLYLDIGNTLDAQITSGANILPADAEGIGASPGWGIAPGPAAVLRGLSWTRKLASDGIVRFVGARVRSVDELVRLAQTLRNPQFETFYVFGMRGETVLEPYAVSSRLPATSKVFVDGGGIEDILTYLRTVKADNFRLLHNHPTGDVTVSKQDKAVTARLARYMQLAGGPKFMGHIVINHFRYSLVEWDAATPNGVTVSEDLWLDELTSGPKLTDPQAKPEVPHKGLGQNLGASWQILSWARNFKRVRDDYAEVVFTDIKNNVRAVMEVRRDRLVAPDFVKDLAQWARDFGASNAMLHAVLPKQGAVAIRDAAKKMIFDGHLADAIFVGENASLVDQGAPYPPWDEYKELGATQDVPASVRVQEEPVPRENQPAGQQMGDGLEPVDRLPPSDGLLWAESLPGKGWTYQPMTFRHLAKIRGVEMPELVTLVQALTGKLPEIEKIAGALGYFQWGSTKAGPKGRIVLDPRLFVDSSVAVRVLAHEVGHLVDYLAALLGDQTINRGNILGRLATLRKYLQSTLPIKPGGGGPPLTKAERAQLAKDAKKAGISYKEALSAELKRRGRLLAEEVHAELWDLSQWWKPLPPTPTPGYMKYRMSSPELYADAISVLFNSPADFMEKAPLFSETWFNYLERKPEVKAEFEALQNLLIKPYRNVLAARKKRIQGMYARADERFLRAWEDQQAQRGTFKGFWGAIKQEFYDIYSPIVDRARKVRKAGGKIDPRFDPEMFFGQHPLGDNQAAVFVQRTYEKVIQPIEAKGMDPRMLGEYMFFNRVMNEAHELPSGEEGGRSNLPNPGGETKETARLALMEMRLNLGAERMELLERQARAFQDLFFDVVKEAVELGVYPRAALPLFEANRYNYATFRVLDRFDPYIPAGLKKQKGTFNPIGNPWLATLLKAISVLRANEKQRAMLVTTKFLRDFFPAEIRPADGSSIRAGERAITMYANGRPIDFIVPKDVAHMFDGVLSPDAYAITRVLDAAFRKIYYPLLITYNPAFQLFTSPMRDVQRAFVNLPRGGGARLAVEYLANILGTLPVEGINATLRGTLGLLNQGLAKVGAPQVPVGQIPVPMTHSARTVRALMGVNPVPGPKLLGAGVRADAAGLAREMFLNSAVGTPYDSFASGQRGDPLGKLMMRYRLLPGEPGRLARVKILKPVLALLKGTEFAGISNELLAKVVGYKFLASELGWHAYRASDFVRNYVGVPNIHKAGGWIRMAQTLAPFVNVMSKGLIADLSLASGQARESGKGSSAAGWWFRWAMVSGVPTFLKIAARYGLLGAFLKVAYDRLSDNDNTNKLPVVVGETGGGTVDGKKTVAIVIPQDETHRLLSALMVRAADLLIEDGHSPLELLAVTETTLPSYNPAIETAFNWGRFLTMQEPRDNYRGENILSPDAKLAGGWAATKEMLLWSYNETGLNRWLKIDPNANTTLEYNLQMMPGINSIVRVSDYGLREKQREFLDSGDAEKAMERLKLGPDARALRREYAALARLKMEGRTDLQGKRWDLLSAWKRKIYAPLEEELEAAVDDEREADAAKIREELQASAREMRLQLLKVSEGQ